MLNEPNLSLTPIYLSLTYTLTYIYIYLHSLLPKRKKENRDVGRNEEKTEKEEKENRDEKRPRRRGKSNREDFSPVKLVGVFQQLYT